MTSTSIDRLRDFLGALASSAALNLLAKLQGGPCAWSDLEGEHSSSVLATRIRDLTGRNLVEDQDGKWGLTPRGRALLAALVPLEDWLRDEVIDRDEFLQIAETLCAKLQMDVRRDGQQITARLGDGDIVLACVGDDEVTLQFRTENEASKGHLKRECERAHSLRVPPLFTDRGTGRRGRVTFTFEVPHENYAPVARDVEEALQWVATRVADPAAEWPAMDRAEFLSEAERLLTEIASSVLGVSQGAINVIGSPHRHYRTVNVAPHVQLGIDAKESGREAPLIRVHLLSSHPDVTSAWSRLASSNEPVDGLLASYYMGPRKGAQQYYGFTWRNDPLNYARWLDRVRACADYLAKDAQPAS